MEEGNEMHDCQMEGTYVTIKTLVIASFALFSTITIPIITGFFFVIDLKLEPIKENVKRNELRASRLESSIISSEKELRKISEGVNGLNNSLSNLKYIFVSKEEAKNFITKEMIDGRLIKSK